MPLAPGQLTALSLLDAYLELLRYSPYPSLWSAETFVNDRLRNDAFQRVQTLARAVEVPLSLLTQPMYSAEFFGTRPDAAYAPLMLEIDGYLTAAGLQKMDSYDLGMQIAGPEYQAKHERAVRAFFLQDLATIFSQYLKFLGQLQQLQGFNDDWLMASSAGARFSIAITNAITASLDQPAIEDLRHVLARLIDPAARCYSGAELVARFDYPAGPRDRLEADAL